MLHVSLPKSIDPGIRKSLRPVVDVAAALVRFVPNSFRWFGIPRKIETCANLGYQPIYPSLFLERACPKTIDPEIHWKFLRDLEEEHRSHTPEVFAICLENGISSNIGANLDKTGVLISELSKQFDLRKGETHKITKSLRFLPKIQHIDDSVGAIAFHGQDNYYHWLFDTLPQFHLLEKAGLKPNKLYIECHKTFQKETLEILGYSPEQVIDSRKVEFISASYLMVPSFPAKSGYAPTWTCDFLRNLLLPLKAQGHLEFPDEYYRRIYLSRRGARRRRILNETALIDFLNPYGFVEVQTDNMSVVDQARLFNNAEVVIAPHGAGLTNLVFCDRHTKVIELFSPQYVNGCYWTLSEQNGLDYFYLVGEGEIPPKYYESGRITDDIEVSLKKLKQIFEFAEIHLHRC
jgi:hypothetical protein